ncbi:hypothetical protein [Actinospongicola halichondriae]|uniref:hypothetical protein n=1 Tax=Actinospongicola halichondriae TaxID=3236844 RepID=UPI003D4BF84F
MNRRSIRHLCAVGVFGAVLAVPSTSAAQADCEQPTVNTLITAESAVSRPVIASPGEYALSNVYSLVEQATRPLFTYAEAGPQYAGAFEALLPKTTPSPPRSVSAHPSTDIPDDHSEDWGGQSTTSVTPTSASAASVGGRSLGVGEATAETVRSWVTSTVECDVVTVIAGWAASEVVLAPGVTVDQMGERVTLVVGPDGSSADVETTLVGVGGAIGPDLDGRPTDPLTDPITENGGPVIEAGEPRTEADAEGASASGGGFNFLLTDPSTGQGAGYRVGSVNVAIEILGALDPSDPTSVDENANPFEDGGALAGNAPTIDPPANVAPHSESGSPPDPSDAALEVERVSVTNTVLSSVEVTTRSWYPLVLTVAVLLALAVSIGLGRLARGRFPTLDWIFVKSDRRILRFLAVYVRW